VDFLIRADRRGRLRYGSLQGRTAAELLPTLPGGNGLASPDGSDPGTLVLVRGGRVFTRSSAALRALALTGGANRVFALFLVIPRPLRDAVYSWVARHRYRWFGRRETCRLPTQSEKSLFLP
jgi:predicted DCC family thiol-disulfide oxidoreductase YuxK